MRRKRKVEKEKGTPSKKKVFLIVGIVLLTIAIIGGALLFWLFPQKAIARGISVEGTNIGGMTVIEAQNALEKTGLENQKIIITDITDAEIELSGADIDLAKDPQKTVENAYKIGREGSLLEKFFERLSVWVTKKEFTYNYSYDTDKLSKILYDFGVSVIGEQKNFTVEYNGDTVTISKGQKGQSKDVSDLLDTVSKAFDDNVFDIVIELKSTEAAVPDVDNVYDEIYQEPKNAEYEIIEGKLKITPEVVGREVNRDDIKDNIDKLADGKNITIKLKTIAPEVTGSSIITQLFGYTLGQFSTSYASSNANRATNVELAAKRINGVILNPNEEFSYNKVVGNRTSANGFKEAPVFANGETVQGMGGGVCQVSSTLYSAVLYADLQVTQRRNHSMTVSYVPKGQDATVSYGTIDFRFKNNTNSPVMISATTAGKKVTISILGAKPDTEKTVKIINSVVNSKSPTIQETVNKSLKPGARKTVSNGKTGYTISTVRKVYENGKEVKSEKMPNSIYAMVPTKVEVGSGTTEASATVENVSDSSNGNSEAGVETPQVQEIPDDIQEGTE